ARGAVREQDTALCEQIGERRHCLRLCAANGTASHKARLRRVDRSMKLYDYAASCNCYKVRLLLAQVGRRYERVPIDIFDGQTLTEEFAQINPARTTPVLETDEGRYLQ